MQNSNSGFINIIRKTNDILVITVFIALACIVFTQVVARYLYHNPLSWTEELARFLQVWMVMLGSSIVMRNGSHLAIDILTSNLSKKNKNRLDIIIYLLMIVFLSIIILYGMKLVSVTKTQRSPAMQIPMSIPYLSFPIGGALMLIEVIIKFIESIKLNKEVVNPHEKEGC